MHADQQRQEIEHTFRTVRRHGVEVDSSSVDSVLLYCRALQAWNERSGLISPHDIPHLIQKHIALSLAPLLIVEPSAGAHWIDVGTGGGLPGMVIKLCRRELEMTLLDSSRKKTIFLEHVQEELRTMHGVAKLTIIEDRVEHLRSGDYDVVLMRAVGALKKTLPLLAGIARPTVRLITFKGERLADELREAEPIMTKLNWTVEDQRSIPWGRSTLLSLAKGNE